MSKKIPPADSVEGRLFRVIALQGLFVFFHIIEFIAIVVLIVAVSRVL